MGIKGRVLVTGGAGYIGSHAVLALLSAGYSVTVLDNLSTGFEWAVPDNASFVKGDVGDEQLIRELLSVNNITAIMHFAGSIIVPESVLDPLKYYRNNSANSRALIDVAIQCGVKHFIFSSTAATYGVPDASPIGENVEKKPINPYGMSKLMTEVMLHDVSKVHDLNYCVFRYFNVAGADPLGRSGQSTTGATHLIKVAVEAFLGLREHVCVYGTDYDTTDGTGVRDYVHVSDLADAHVLALEKLIESSDKSYILNCGYGKGFSVLEVLDSVDRVTGQKVIRKIEGRRPGDPSCLVADNSAILATLPWRPKFDDIDEIIRHALEWERFLLKRKLV